MHRLTAVGSIRAKTHGQEDFIRLDDLDGMRVEFYVRPLQ